MAILTTRHRSSPQTGKHLCMEASANYVDELINTSQVPERFDPKTGKMDCWLCDAIAMDKREEVA